MENVETARSFQTTYSQHAFEGIIGNSTAFQSAFAQVELVGRTDSTVLILGETGTGKELIAHSIHRLSVRNRGPFVKLNCSAIPFDLLESELFGHEKGAFTGAIAQKIGRFELANGGTLFLDEIGDIPLALQPKLLRVLQEREFERLGSGRTHRVDVRLVAATHRDLAQMVRQNEFRSDLFYRLNVFPVSLPPLRARREDIAQLVSYFVEIIGRRVGKHITDIPKETLEALISHSWPGNVRELQNLVERALILSQNGVLPNLLSAPERSIAGNLTLSFPGQHKLLDSERALILEALETAGWTVGGPHGAASRLGVKRTTLYAKMKRFGISRFDMATSFK